MIGTKFFKVQIHGDEWVVYMADEQDNIIVEEGSVAETDFYKKHIIFKEFDFHTISHELFHAYLGYCYIYSADLSAYQIEEVCCELFSDKGQEILDKAKEIYKKFKELV